MKTGYEVGNCMTIQPITISKDMTLAECARLMKDKHVGSLLVLEKGNLIGLVTEQDLVRKAMAENKDPTKTFVRDIMINELITIAPAEDIYEALKKMRDYNIRHLPVVERGKLAGFLTMKDILKIQPQLFDLIVERIELREEARKPLADEDEGVCDGCGNYSQELEEVDGTKLCPACRAVEDNGTKDEENEEEFI
ncbi:MAG: CBS domain-containing protein [archaeon]